MCRTRWLFWVIWYESYNNLVTHRIFLSEILHRLIRSRAADNFDPGWANKAQLISFIDTGLRNSKSCHWTTLFFVPLYVNTLMQVVSLRFHLSIHKRLMQFFTLDKFFHGFISLVIFEIISSAGVQIRPNPMHNSLKGKFSL